MAIESPQDPQLAQLCKLLEADADHDDQQNSWPEKQLRLLGDFGVYRWFLQPQWGGVAWDPVSILQGYRALASACLATTFILTQRAAACQRIQASDNLLAKQQLLPGLASGESFATVGISQLTTSRQHLDRPVLTATRTSNGYLLDGYSPWVTGARAADFVVVGAHVLENDPNARRQILVALPAASPGFDAELPARLVGLGSSHTGTLRLHQVHVDDAWLLAGPVPNVLAPGSNGATGGYQTSALAIGLASAAIAFMNDESSRRNELSSPCVALGSERDQLERDLLAAAAGDPSCTTELLRHRANSLALRATQASLASAKGAGFVAGHPTGRWCREALFFLVWSCPQPVVQANLCELARIE